jgi:signal transduction histidine kinase
VQVVSEFRALRAAVLRVWGLEAGGLNREDVEDLTRLSEPIEHEGTGELAADFDHARIHQVLINLLNNAVQHGDAGSPIPLAVGQERDRVRLVVRNRGTPIPPEALQVLVNPLVQVAKAKSEPHERPSTSLGLGLDIAGRSCRRHD